MRLDDDRRLEHWRRRVRQVIPSADLDLTEEIAGHLADRWQRARLQGASEEAADRQAEDDLAAWHGRPLPRRAPPRSSARWWRGWSTDVRDASRSLRLRPAFSVGSVSLAAVALAGVTCGFAIVFGILLRPLPYPAADRLAVIWQVRGNERTQISYPDYANLASLPVFDSTAAMSGGRGSLRVGDRIERINALSIEAPGLALLGAAPVLGRLLTAADADQPVAMISHRLWTTHLAADPAVVGRILWLSGREYTVVGVLPAGFDFELPVPPTIILEDNDVWTIVGRSAPFRDRRDVSTYEALVRLAPDRSASEAQAALDAMAATLAAEHPSTNVGRTFQIASLREEVVAPMRRPLLLVAVAAAVTFCIALANLVVLGLVRTSERHLELAVREALGAGALRLRRQLLTENLAIALCGAAAGAAAAYYVVQWLVSSEAAHLPRADAIRFDRPVWVVLSAATLLVTAILTVQPLRARTSLLRSATRTIAASGQRSRRVMVAVEIALAVTLATGGALLALSLFRLLAVDPGFEPRAAAAARVSIYETDYPTGTHVVRFLDEVIARLQQMPDIAFAGAGSSLPLSGQNVGTSVVAEGASVRPGERPTAGWQFVSPRYFAAAGMRLRAGRDFSEADRRGSTHVTIINETLARQLFSGADPIGRRIGVGGGDSQGDWHEIIDVVDDVRHEALSGTTSPRVYDLFGQHWGRTLYVVARSRTGASALPNIIRSTVATLDPQVPVFETATLQTLVDRSAATRRLASTVAAWLAAAGIFLALLGVYAISAASVAERTREIGVRAALGATPRDLFRLFAGEGASAILGGSLVGSAASLAAAQLLQAQLFGVQPFDLAWLVPLTVTGVITATLLAAVPAGRRAASADPVVAMRNE